MNFLFLLLCAFFNLTVYNYALNVRDSITHVPNFAQS